MRLDRWNVVGIFATFVLMRKEGYIHLYTGDGKGKTTAAFGLALRALCAGRSVAVGQFVKSMRYNETRAETLFDGCAVAASFGRLHVEQFGRGCFLDRRPDPADMACARDGLARCAGWLSGGEYDVVVLDELTIALHCGLLTVGEVLDTLALRAPQTEVVITGRYAPQELYEVADLVTEMREVKHYYRQGVLSRDGIDR